MSKVAPAPPGQPAPSPPPPFFHDRGRTLACTEPTAATARVPGQGRLRRQDPDRQRHHHVGNHRRGDKAVAYACDGNTIESWLRGSAKRCAEPGQQGQDQRLEGRLEGSAVVGTLSIVEKKWDFKAPAAQPPAGLMSTRTHGVRDSWIVDPNGGVTGVQRRADGSTSPAPRLTPTASRSSTGVKIKAIRVQGASDVLMPRPPDSSRTASRSLGVAVCRVALGAGRGWARCVRQCA